MVLNILCRCICSSLTLSQSLFIDLQQIVHNRKKIICKLQRKHQKLSLLLPYFNKHITTVFTVIFPPTSSVVVIRTVTEAATSMVPRLPASSVSASNASTFSSVEPSYNSDMQTMLFDCHLVQKFMYDNREGRFTD